MNKNIKKTIISIFSITVISSVLIGCKKDKKTTSDLLLDSNKDKKTTVCILTQEKDMNKQAYDVAESEVENYTYRTSTDSDSQMIVKHLTLPKNYTDNNVETEKVFDKIKKDKNINVLVVSSNKGGITKYVKELKKDRKDLLTISAGVNEEVQALIDNFDLNFAIENLQRGQRIVQLAKSFGANRMVCFATENELKIDLNKKIYDGMRLESKKDELPITLDIIPSNLEPYQRKAYISNKIDEYLKLYGHDIDLYTFDNEYDEVLASKILNDKFFVTEFSQRNINPELMKIYGIKELSRQRYGYVLQNSQIGTFIKVNSNLSRRIASYGANPNVFAIQFSANLGYILKAKDIPVKKAYNSYFLEKVSFARLGLESGFINKSNSVGNYKIIDLDQIIY